MNENNGPGAAEAIGDLRETKPTKIPKALQSVVDRVYEINYAELPQELKTWIAEHPYQTAFHIVNGVVFFYPNLFTGPILWSLGWTSLGPRAGSAAAALMAKVGALPSGGLFAYLQSTAMGGYGVPVVQGVTRAGSAVVVASNWLISYWHGPKPKKGD